MSMSCLLMYRRSAPSVTFGAAEVRRKDADTTVYFMRETCATLGVLGAFFARTLTVCPLVGTVAAQAFVAPIDVDVYSKVEWIDLIAIEAEAEAAAKAEQQQQQPQAEGKAKADAADSRDDDRGLGRADHGSSILRKIATPCSLHFSSSYQVCWSPAPMFEVAEPCCAGYAV